MALASSPACLNGSDEVKNANRMTLFGLGVMVALLNLSGCTRVEEDHGPYRFEHGDRVDRDGHREVRWCDGHHEDEHCR
jgi:hypothetical protein